MALQINKKSRFGDAVQATYHKVVSMQVDWVAQRATINLMGFADKATADSKTAQPLTQLSVLFSNNPRESHFGFNFAPTDNIVQKAYQAIKLAPGWTQATDV